MRRRQKTAKCNTLHYRLYDLCIFYVAIFFCITFFCITFFYPAMSSSQRQEREWKASHRHIVQNFLLRGEQNSAFRSLAPSILDPVSSTQNFPIAIDESVNGSVLASNKDSSGNVASVSPSWIESDSGNILMNSESQRQFMSESPFEKSGFGGSEFPKGVTFPDAVASKKFIADSGSPYPLSGELSRVMSPAGLPPIVSATGSPVVKNKFALKWSLSEQQRLKKVLAEERVRHDQFTTIDWAKEIENDVFEVAGAKRKCIPRNATELGQIAPNLSNAQESQIVNNSANNASSAVEYDELLIPFSLGKSITRSATQPTSYQVFLLKLLSCFGLFESQSEKSISLNNSPTNIIKMQAASESEVCLASASSKPSESPYNQCIRYLNFWSGLWFSVQGWILAALIGCTIGVVCAMVDTITTWFVSFREGLCMDKPQLSIRLCCPADYNVNFYLTGSCSNFSSWDDLLATTFLSGIPPIIIFSLFCCLFALLSGWLVSKYTPFAAGSGIPEIKTILSGIIINGVLTFYIIVVKSATLALSVGSGLAIGKEGPYIHLAAAIGSVWCKFFPKYRTSETRKREMISAACACGVSCAFGAPLGGVLFAMEEMVTYFPPKTLWKTFFCSIAGCLILKYLDPVQSGTLVLFDVQYTRQWMWLEVIPFMLCGVIGGLVGAALIHANGAYHAFRSSSLLSKFPLCEIACVAMLTGFVKYPIIELRSDVYEVMKKLFLSCESGIRSSYLCNLDQTDEVLLTLLACFLITFFLAVISFGMKVPAGIFIPSLFMGACLGRMVGTIVWWLQNQYSNSFYFRDCSSFISSSSFGCISPAIYAIVCAASCLTGVTRLTVSSVVIMFEITGSLSTVVPVMIGVVIAKWVGDAFGRANVAAVYINLSKYPFLEPQEEISVDATCVLIFLFL